MKRFFPILLILIAGMILLATPAAVEASTTQITGTIPLRIYDVEVTPTSTQATISWKTNGPSTSQVFYDTHSYVNRLDYRLKTDKDYSRVIEHRQVLNGLQENTLYYFQVESIINIGDVAQPVVSAEFNFQMVDPPAAGGGALSTKEVTYSLQENQSTPGVFKSNTAVQSSDSYVSLAIPQGTTFNEASGLGGTCITIEPMPLATRPSPPSGGNVIGMVYNLGPQGSTFNRPITLTLTYDPVAIPPGIDPATLVIGYWDYSTERWIELPDARVDPRNHTVSGSLRHFTPYSILYRPGLAKFSINGLNITPREAVTGQEVTISGTVINSGISSGEYPLNLMIDGRSTQMQKIILDAGSSREIKFTVQAGPPGNYEIFLNGLKGNLTVNASSNQSPEALFRLTGLTISPENVSPGDEVSINARIENFNTYEVTRKISLRLNDSVIENRIITIAAESSQQVSFIISPDKPGTYVIGLEGLSHVFSVVDRIVPPIFVLSDIEITPDKPVLQQQVTVNAVVSNIGNIKGSRPVSFKVNGKEVDTKELTLAGNASQNVSFNFLPDKIGVSWIQIDDRMVQLPVKIPPVFTMLLRIIIGIGCISLIVLLIIRTRIKSHHAAI